MSKVSTLTQHSISPPVMYVYHGEILLAGHDLIIWSYPSGSAIIFDIIIIIPNDLMIDRWKDDMVISVNFVELGMELQNSPNQDLLL